MAQVYRQRLKPSDPADFAYLCQPERSKDEKTDVSTPTFVLSRTLLLRHGTQNLEIP